MTMRTDKFVERHIGPNEEEIKKMLVKINADSIEELLEETIPPSIRLDKPISYNIRYNNPKDGMNVWENRKATVMGLLNEQSADFVGLQEVVHAQLLENKFIL